MKNKLKKRATLQLLLAIVLVVFGCALIVAAFLLPPLAEIHASVLTAFGEILTFAGAIIGVDYSYKKVELHKRNDDEEEERA